MTQAGIEHAIDTLHSTILSLHCLKNVQYGRHNQRSGQYTLAPQKICKKIVFKVLLLNLAAHNVNVTGRVCYFT
jgi:hypothetical protein